jgi:hypothetical protein
MSGGTAIIGLAMSDAVVRANILGLEGTTTRGLFAKPAGIPNGCVVVVIRLWVVVGVDGCEGGRNMLLLLLWEAES